ncbi:hypothetical protein CTI12_AA186940 [Artemisia annua]|uniref:Uncharacterized protein n=1 Tax=Artemisia annua TaxID=35608 RepID=A0A2U1P6Y1_ARTAN|nr:hypothetical protein CTI12_AA186940 [Artemisia annua]
MLIRDTDAVYMIKTLVFVSYYCTQFFVAAGAWKVLVNTYLLLLIDYAGSFIGCSTRFITTRHARDCGYLVLIDGADWCGRFDSSWIIVGKQQTWHGCESFIWFQLASSRLIVPVKHRSSLSIFVIGIAEMEECCQKNERMYLYSPYDCMANCSYHSDIYANIDGTHALESTNTVSINGLNSVHDLSRADQCSTSKSTSEFHKFTHTSGNSMVHGLQQYMQQPDSANSCCNSFCCQNFNNLKSDSGNCEQFQLSQTYEPSRMNTNFTYMNPNKQSSHLVVNAAQTPVCTSNDPQTSCNNIEMATEDTSGTRNYSEISDLYIDLGDCCLACQYCNAGFWYGERLKEGNSTRLKYSKCCADGQVYLPKELDPPLYFKQLFKDKHFLDNIRAYNQMFSMTSYGAQLMTQ